LILARILIFDPLKLVVVGAAVFGCGIILLSLIGDFRRRVANGKRPAQNDRRRMEFEQATRAAMQSAETAKSAADYRLRLQIREAEGLAKTVAEKEADVRRILATL
jgi:hypothetical protein